MGSPHARSCQRTVITSGAFLVTVAARASILHATAFVVGSAFSISTVAACFSCQVTDQRTHVRRRSLQDYSAAPLALHLAWSSKNTSCSGTVSRRKDSVCAHKASRQGVIQQYSTCVVWRVATNSNARGRRL